MKISKELDQLISGSPDHGRYLLPELLRITGAGQMNGLAVAKEDERVFYLSVLAGEPEGAVSTDEDGELYGDKAIVRLTGREMFTLYEIPADLITAIVMGCRIFEKSHLKKNLAHVIPEIGKKPDGIGILTLVVKQNEEPRNGFRVSLRYEGRVLGSDITTGDGTVRFRLGHGEYDCIVQDRAGTVFSFRITFDDAHAVQTVAV
ncbi:hypothetical protein [uncultured Methanoregula sp.]|uniref:hypothetical protein n=1 Tax=uncultured Methanoregula sp. TaxID=1005933 RepID=UPI002AAB9E97|nr:hypothetical protein [uncultured Methanoregula sp.]